MTAISAAGNSSVTRRKAARSLGEVNQASLQCTPPAARVRGSAQRGAGSPRAPSCATRPRNQIMKETHDDHREATLGRGHGPACHRRLAHTLSRKAGSAQDPAPSWQSCRRLHATFVDSRVPPGSRDQPDRECMRQPMTPLFKDRVEAGRRLTAALAGYARDRALFVPDRGSRFRTYCRAGVGLMPRLPVSGSRRTSCARSARESSRCDHHVASHSAQHSRSVDADTDQRTAQRHELHSTTATIAFLEVRS
jgi:hypothetical protein